MLDKYGIDVVRLYVLSKAPPELVLDWNERDILGQQRWTTKLYKLTVSLSEKLCGSTFEQLSASSSERLEDFTIRQLVNDTIANVTVSLEKNQFHNAISFLIKFLNALLDDVHMHPILLREALSTFSKLLFPFAPILACEVWSLLNPQVKILHYQCWPLVDKQCINPQDNRVAIKVMLQSKPIIELEFLKELLEDETQIFNVVLQNSVVQEKLLGQPIKKLMFIKKSMVNILI